MILLNKAFLTTGDKVLLMSEWPAAAPKNMPDNKGGTAMFLVFQDVPGDYAFSSKTEGVKISANSEPFAVSSPLTAARSKHGRKQFLEKMGKLYDDGLVGILEAEISPGVATFDFSIKTGASAPVATPKPASAPIIDDDIDDDEDGDIEELEEVAIPASVITAPKAASVNDIYNV